VCGDVILYNVFDNYQKMSGVINYFVIIVISILYFLSNLTGRKVLRLFLLPSVFLILFLLLILLDLTTGGIESPSGFLYITTSITCSLFEYVNFIIGNIHNDFSREISFFLFNSLGVSSILLFLSILVDYLDILFSRIRRNETQ